MAPSLSNRLYCISNLFPPVFLFAVLLFLFCCVSVFLVCCSCFCCFCCAVRAPRCDVRVTDVHHETKRTQWEPPTEEGATATAPTAPPPYSAITQPYSDAQKVVTATAVVENREVRTRRQLYAVTRFSRSALLFRLDGGTVPGDETGYQFQQQVYAYCVHVLPRARLRTRTVTHKKLYFSAKPFIASILTAAVVSSGRVPTSVRYSCRLLRFSSLRRVLVSLLRAGVRSRSGHFLCVFGNMSSKHFFFFQLKPHFV